MGKGFIEMSLELNKVLGRYKSEEERLDDIDWRLKKTRTK